MGDSFPMTYTVWSIAEDEHNLIGWRSIFWSQVSFSLKESFDVGSRSRHEGRHSHGPSRLFWVVKGYQRHFFHPRKAFWGMDSCENPAISVCCASPFWVIMRVEESEKRRGYSGCGRMIGVSLRPQGMVESKPYPLCQSRQNIQKSFRFALFAGWIFLEWSSGWFCMASVPSRRNRTSLRVGISAGIVFPVQFNNEMIYNYV